jgi:hypothetical protein
MRVTVRVTPASDVSPQVIALQRDTPAVRSDPTTGSTPAGSIRMARVKARAISASVRGERVEPASSAAGAAHASPRARAASIANASGSYSGAGAWPMRPVRYSDHGSSCGAYAVRTCRMIAFMRRSTARSMIAISSLCCC